jgi:Domain of unknown function (DUF4389)
VLNLLVVVAGTFLLLTGRYPHTLFDLLLGINRWLYRTFTYLTLMSTAYPPFRLDQGPTSPIPSRYTITMTTSPAATP